ncbi:GyrI-like domain-containing protein [Aquitalea sp. ASV15]|uniref:AraC family transcriptional regulator n=1 Tax=Aquitalea sp. ASV15 TaxID=2795104 RepID=UPI0018EA3B31|nr:GyrI-like domain-containing protein [Aquitalea sp. ASV15]
MYQPEIIHLAQPLPVLMKPHLGPYSGIATAFADLRALVQQHADGAHTLRAFGQYLDDPATVAPQALRAAACLTPPPALRLSASEVAAMGFSYGELAAGRYACIVHQGPYTGLAEAWNWLIQEWLPASGEQFGQRPLLDEALSGPHAVAPEAWRTRLLLPLA